MSPEQALGFKTKWQELKLPPNSEDTLAPLQETLDFLVHLAHHLNPAELEDLVFHPPAHDLIIKASNEESLGPSRVVVELLNHVTKVVTTTAARANPPLPGIKGMDARLWIAGLRCLGRCALRADDGGRFSLRTVGPLTHWLRKSYKSSRFKPHDLPDLPAVFMSTIDSLALGPATEGINFQDQDVRNHILRLIGTAFCSWRTKEAISPRGDEAEYKAFARYMRFFLKTEASSKRIYEDSEPLFPLVFQYVALADDTMRQKHLDDACMDVLGALKGNGHLEEMGISWNLVRDVYTVGRYELANHTRVFNDAR